MDRRPRLVLLLSAWVLWGCGPTASRTQLSSPTPATPPSETHAREAGSEVAPPPASSVVRFDDLGMSYEIPPGWTVLGDEELARSVRASRALRREADKREHLARLERKQGVPLLTLRSEVGHEGMMVVLSAVSVPVGTTAMDTLADQSKKLKVAYEEWQLVHGPAPLQKDGVEGAELVDVYRGPGGRRVRGTLRLFVRGTSAFLLAVNRTDAGDAPSPAAIRMLEGIRFFEPRPRDR